MFIFTSQSFSMDITDYIERTTSIKQQYFLFRNFTTWFSLVIKRKNNTHPPSRELKTFHSAFVTDYNRIYYEAKHRTWLEEEPGSIKLQLLVTR